MIILVDSVIVLFGAESSTASFQLLGSSNHFSCDVPTRASVLGFRLVPSFRPFLPIPSNEFGRAFRQSFHVPFAWRVSFCGQRRSR